MNKNIGTIRILRNSTQYISHTKHKVRNNTNYQGQYAILPVIQTVWNNANYQGQYAILPVIQNIKFGSIRMLTDSTQYHETVIQPNGREYRRGNHKWTIQRNWQHRVHKTKKNTKKHNAICVGHKHTNQEI
jgi:hypothetical protein